MVTNFEYRTNFTKLLGYQFMLTCSHVMSYFEVIKSQDERWLKCPEYMRDMQDEVKTFLVKVKEIIEDIRPLEKDTISFRQINNLSIVYALRPELFPETNEQREIKEYFEDIGRICQLAIDDPQPIKPEEAEKVRLLADTIYSRIVAEEDTRISDPEIDLTS